MVVKSPLVRCTVIEAFTLKNGDTYQASPTTMRLPADLAARLVEAGKVKILPPAKATQRPARKVLWTR